MLPRKAEPTCSCMKNAKAFPAKPGADKLFQFTLHIFENRPTNNVIVTESIVFFFFQNFWKLQKFLKIVEWGRIATSTKKKKNKLRASSLKIFWPFWKIKDKKHAIEKKIRLEMEIEAGQLSSRFGHDERLV